MNTNYSRQLNDENKKYYDEFLSSLGSQIMGTEQKSSVKSNPVAEDILSQILAAQMHGKRAVDYFGFSANELAVNVSKEMPTKYKRLLIWAYLGLFVAGLIISYLLKDSTVPYLGLLGLGGSAISYFINRGFVTKTRQQRKVYQYLLLGAWFVLLTLTFYLLAVTFHFDGL